jgi:hypothetical protein
MDDLARFYAYYIIYPIFGVGFVALTAARLPRNRMRIPVIVLAAAIATGALFLEHLVAKAEFDTLCGKSAGGRIIATVDAPPEEFGARFRIAQADAPFPSAWNEVTAHSVTLTDASTNTLLAEYRRLSAPNRLPPFLSGSRYGPCPTSVEEKAFIESLPNVFKRAAP